MDKIKNKGTGWDDIFKQIKGLKEQLDKAQEYIKLLEKYNKAAEEYISGLEEYKRAAGEWMESASTLNKELREENVLLKEKYCA